MDWRDFRRCVDNHSMRRIRILFLCYSFGDGGRERVLADILRLIDYSRFEVAVCTLMDENIYPDLAQLPLRWVSLSMPTTSLRMLRNLPKLVKLGSLIRSFVPDVIHSQGPDADFYAQCFGRFLGVRTIMSTLHINNVMLEDPSLLTKKQSLKLLLQKWCFHLTDVVLAVSTATRQFAIEQQGVPPQRVLVLRNAVPGMQRTRSRHAAQLSLFGRNNEFVFGYVGRLAMEKNLFTLLQAFVHVREKLPHPRLVLVGDGPVRSALEHEVQQLGMKEVVTFAGAQSRVDPWYEAIDVLLLPSFIEGLPLVVLEAMSLGIPIIAARVGGVAEVLTHNANAILVASPDQQLLVDAVRAQAGRTECDAVQAKELAFWMLKLARDGSLVQQLGRQAERDFIEHFSVRRNVRVLESYYRQCAGRHMPRFIAGS